MLFIGVVRGRLRISALFSDLLEVAGRDLSIFPQPSGGCAMPDLTRHMRHDRMVASGCMPFVIIASASAAGGIPGILAVADWAFCST
jgi:hypothetical protein